MSDARSSDVETLRDALRRTTTFIYDHIAVLVGVSIVWSLASIPLLTVGPATVGAYAAIDSLRDSGRLDYDRVRAVVRSGFVHAVLLSGVLLAFGTVGAAYAVRYVTTGDAFAAGLAVVAAYATVYAILVLMPAFVAMSRGDPPRAALRQGWRWTAAHPTLSLTAGLLTLLVFAGTALLTVAFVLFFPALAFSFHLELFSPPRARATGTDTTCTAVI